MTTDVSPHKQQLHQHPGTTTASPPPTPAAKSSLGYNGSALIFMRPRDCHQQVESAMIFVTIVAAPHALSMQRPPWSRPTACQPDHESKPPSSSTTSSSRTVKYVRHVWPAPIKRLSTRSPRLDTSLLIAAHWTVRDHTKWEQHRGMIFLTRFSNMPISSGYDYGRFSP